MPPDKKVAFAPGHVGIVLNLSKRASKFRTKVEKIVNQYDGASIEDWPANIVINSRLRSQKEYKGMAFEIHLQKKGKERVKSKGFLPAFFPEEAIRRDILRRGLIKDLETLVTDYCL